MRSRLISVGKAKYIVILATSFACADFRALAAETVNEGLRGDDAINQLHEKEAAIEVTINPEARVSIKRTNAPLTMPQCGKSGAWLVRVINQGFVTAGLNFRTAASSISLETVLPRLTGAVVEYRLLHFMMNETHQMEITLAVDAGSATSDIGGRAILPLLLQCR